MNFTSFGGGGYNKKLRDLIESKRVNVILRMTVNSGFFNYGFTANLNMFLASTVLERWGGGEAWDQLVLSWNHLLNT